MSPVIYGIGGEIEKLYVCKNCLDNVTKLEYFISLNFKKITMDELITIRSKFKDEGYEEGIKFEALDKKKPGVIERLFSLNKKKEAPKPVATIRDYLCHLNLLQKDEIQYMTITKIVLQAMQYHDCHRRVADFEQISLHHASGISEFRHR